jgi:RND family efflux transporter MFP subunit
LPSIMTNTSPPAYPRWLPLLVLLIGLVACGPSAPPEEPRGERPHLVETVPVVSANLSLVRTRTGSLRARHEVMIHTQEEGRIIEYPFYEGDRVAAGEVLVRLDDALIQAQLDRATATRKQAEQDLRRLRELRARNLVSEDEFTRAQTQLEVAKADEQLLRTRLGYTNIKSPIDGVITARLSEPGNVVERLRHVLTVADLSSLHTTVEVSELVLPQLRVGDPASVRIDALGGALHTGRIVRLFPTLDPVTRRGTVEVELEPVPAGAAPGQLCRVEFTTQASDRFVIPFSALRRDDVSEYVLVVDAEQRAQRVEVISGLRLAEMVEILSGLEEGQQVITKGFLGLSAGKTVKPVTPVAAEAS